MKGGKREGAGRPKVNKPQVKPVSWRPKTQAIRDQYIDLGGARWLDRIVGEALEKTLTEPENSV